MKFPREEDAGWPPRDWYLTQREKTNLTGFSNSFTPLQILSLLLFAIPITLFILTLSQFPNLKLKIIIGVVLGVLEVSTGLFWFSVTSIDPSDSVQQEHLNSIMEGTSFQTQQHYHICSSCQTYTSKNTHHCRRCERCVQLFDHHCQWLNNCIGAKNYLEFVGMILLETLSLAFIFTVTVYALTQFSNASRLWIKYISIINASLTLALLLPNFALLVFHISLIVRKKATIDLIFEVRRQKTKQASDHVQNSEVKMVPIYNTGVKTEKTTSQVVIPGGLGPLKLNRFRSNL